MRRERVKESLRDCTLCPRACHADRVSGRLGYCHTGAGFEIGSICLHRGEEPVVGGSRGICNVFFGHCNLQCRYCQNHQISRNTPSALTRHLGLKTVVERIERILEQGAQAVGFVSPSHVRPQMESIMRALQARGRKPVFVYNTNAYDRDTDLAALAGRMHVYLPDMKYLDPGLAAAYSDAPDYPDVASRALREMFRQKGSRLETDDQGQIRSGLIVRHLVLPGQVENSKRVLRFIAEELSPDVTVSLMAQYVPIPDVAQDPLLGRVLTAAEYQEVVAEAERLGLTQGWIQELESRNIYCPDFLQTHPFGVAG